MIKSWTRRQLITNTVRALAVVGIGKGFFNATRYHVELVKVKVTIPNLPKSFKGLKAALLSDFHSSKVVGRGLIEASAKLAMEEKPDVIFFTGDFISGSTKFLSGSIGDFNKKYLDRCIDALSPLDAPMGIYAVLGNHDFWSGPEAVETITGELSKRLSVQWLRNKSISLKKGGEQVDLLGVDDYWETTSSLNKAYKGLNEKNVKILLSHNPDINDTIDNRNYKIDMVVSGHTHGGQIVVPFIGMPFVPSQFGQKYRAGLVRDGHRQTYITRGVGHLLAPIRLNCPPEVTVLTFV